MPNRPWWKWPTRDRDQLWPDPPRRLLRNEAGGAGADAVKPGTASDKPGSDAAGSGEENKAEEPIQLSWLDALAFAIAMFQILLPYFLAVAGAIIGVYGLFWLLFRR